MLTQALPGHWSEDHTRETIIFLEKGVVVYLIHSTSSM